MSKEHESKKVRIESRSEREGVNAHYITPNYSRMVYKPLPVAFILREGGRERYRTHREREGDTGLIEREGERGREKKCLDDKSSMEDCSISLLLCEELT